MMRKAYASGPQPANSSPAKSCGIDRNIPRLNSQVAHVARELFTLKTAQTLADLTGYSARSCEYWLSPTNPVAIPSDALVSLLRSEFGRQFLEAVMDQSPAAWWQSALSYFGILDAMRFQRSARRKLKAALDADNDLAASIARSEAALSFQDEDFMRSHVDGLRAQGSPSHRAMATSKGRGNRR